PYCCNNWCRICNLSLTRQVFAHDLYRLRTPTGNDCVTIIRNTQDNLLLHMQQKVVLGILCNVRVHFQAAKQKLLDGCAACWRFLEWLIYVIAYPVQDLGG